MLEQDGVDNLVTVARNDIEQVSVRAGCTFTGFEDSDFNGEMRTGMWSSMTLMTMLTWMRTLSQSLVFVICKA